MSCHLQINTNTKLFQKFMERKSQKRPQSKIEKGNSNQSQGSFSSSNFKSSDRTIGNENIDTTNLPSLSFVQNSEKIDDLLKKQLQRQRSKTMIDSLKVETIQVIPKQRMEIQLQIDYLRSQNKNLRQKLRKQTQKNSFLQHQLKQMTLKSKQTEEVLEKTRQSLKSAIDQLQKQRQKEKFLLQQNTAGKMDQISRLKEQNYLAKDYLYKLTVKLYQQEQKNKLLYQEIEKLDPTNRLLIHQQALKQRPSEVRESEKNEVQTNSKSKYQRISQIQQELDEINASKVLNGKSRRKKIELQRQIQLLNSS